MAELATGALGRWLEEKCREQGLSLRQASLKIGISHTGISDLLKGANPSPQTIKKLAQAFSGDGEYHRQALEDELLRLCGYRSERPKAKEFTEPMARLLDKLSGFSEPELKIMSRFADFIRETQTDIIGGKNTGRGVKR